MSSLGNSGTRVHRRDLGRFTVLAPLFLGGQEIEIDPERVVGVFDVPVEGSCALWLDGWREPLVFAGSREHWAELLWGERE